MAHGVSHYLGWLNHLADQENLFKHKKVRYKGLAKNEAQLFSLFGLANLVIAKRRLLELHARGVS